ncbi:hypothetical protein RRF57_003651 [Xylaria bambusicola]|uniref:Uncharacterized protein n=1 Tax=Xylaria bambusicola TaxID=326684 RepID=A0AAN7Z7T5_9PEZI
MRGNSEEQNWATGEGLGWCLLIEADLGQLEPSPAYWAKKSRAGVNWKTDPTGWKFCDVVDANS